MVAPNVAEIAFAKQSAAGTPNTTAAHRLLMAGGDQPHPMVTQDWYTETTGQRMLYDRYVSEAHVEGAPQHYVMPASAVELIRGALGAIASVGSGAPYTHTITPAATQPWYTVWRKLSTLVYERFTDCKVKSIVIHGESGRPLTITVNWLGITPQRKTAGVYATEVAVTAEKSNRFLHYDGAGALMVEGVAVASINSFDITIENNSTAEAGDSLTPNTISEGGLEVTVRASQLFTSAALRDRLYYASSSPADNAAITNTLLELTNTPPLQFTFTRVAAAPGPEVSMAISVARVSVEPFDVTPTAAPSPALRADVTYHAHMPANDSAPITVVVKNASAAAIYP